MNSFTFLFKEMKETHEQRQTKIDIDEFRSGTLTSPFFPPDPLLEALAGKVGCRHVEMRVKMTDVSVRPTCCRHVGRHVGATTQKAVGRGTRPTCHSMSLADMSAICQQHDKYLAVGFEHMSMLLFLDSPATLPIRTCVLICRVAGISSNMSAA